MTEITDLPTVIGHPEIDYLPLKLHDTIVILEGIADDSYSAKISLEMDYDGVQVKITLMNELVKV